MDHYSYKQTVQYLFKTLISAYKKELVDNEFIKTKRRKIAIARITIVVVLAAVVAVCFLTEPKMGRNKASLNGVEVVSKELNTAVHESMLANQADKGWQGECGTEGHIVLWTKETKTETVVYVLHSYASFGFVNDCFVEVGGHSMPLAIHFRRTEDGYNLSRIDTPKDGGDYAASVRHLFPDDCRDRIFSQSEADAEALWRQCVSQAEKYLELIGRSAEVRRDVEYIWLDDVIDSDIANNAICVNPELTGYPLWIGTREQIENGVRYLYTTIYEPETKGKIYFKILQTKIKD